MAKQVWLNVAVLGMLMRRTALDHTRREGNKHARFFGFYEFESYLLILSSCWKFVAEPLRKFKGQHQRSQSMFA